LAEPNVFHYVKMIRKNVRLYRLDQEKALGRIESRMIRLNKINSERDALYQVHIKKSLQLDRFLQLKTSASIRNKK